MNAYIESRDGHKFPLYRSGGLWKFDVRFMRPEGARAYDSAYRAACDAASESSVGDIPQSARAMSVVSPLCGNMHVPGAFADASPCCSVHGSSNSPSRMFANVSKCASCTSCHHRITGSCGSVSADMLIHGIELSLPSNIQLNDDNAARIMQRVANMKMYHVLYRHANVEFLNKLVRVKVITDGILLDSISCAHCASSKMKKADVSKTKNKSYPNKPFHIVQGDIFDAEDADSRNGFKCVLVFIDVLTGSVFQYFMVAKSEALYGFKAFENWLALISPEVEAKWGAPISLACVAFDRDGAPTTTYGNMQSEADNYFISKGYNRLFTSSGSSNGTEKVERYMKPLKAGARMNLR